VVILVQSWIAIGTGTLGGKAHDAPRRVDRFLKSDTSPQIPPVFANSFPPLDSTYRKICRGALTTKTHREFFAILPQSIVLLSTEGQI
jgi:hypothetical protein